MRRRLLIAAGLVAFLVIASLVALSVTPVRYTSVGRAFNGFPDLSVAENLCRENMPASLRETVSGVSGTMDRWTWVVRGNIGGATPGPWTCRVTMGDSGAMLYVDSLDLPG